jgi:hypothetical protein
MSSSCEGWPGLRNKTMDRSPRYTSCSAQGGTVDARSQTWPNKGLELTAYSVRSCLASASGSSSRLALGVATTRVGAELNGQRVLRVAGPWC